MSVPVALRAILMRSANELMEECAQQDPQSGLEGLLECVTDVQGV